MVARISPNVGSDPRILAEQVTLLYRQMRVMLTTSFFVVALAVGALWPFVRHSDLLVWAGFAWTFAAVRLLMISAFSREVDGRDMRRWGKYAVIASLIYGTVLGGGSWVFASSSEAMGLMFWGALLIAIIGGAIQAQAAYLWAFVALAAPALIGLGTALIFAGEATNDSTLKILGLVAFIYLLVAFSSARNVHRTVTDALRLRFENEDLAHQLGIEKDRSEEAAAAKSRFFASANHDLRQPLHALGLFTESLEKEVHTQAGKRLMRHLRFSAAALEGLVSKMLEMSKIESGTVEVNHRVLELMPLLRNLHAEFALEAASKGLLFTVRKTRAYVRSDPLLLERILRNLIGNAIRYTPNGSVLVACRPRGGEIVIEVRDSGIGIPAAQEERIFEAFYQTQNVERDRDKGIGLGLAIVRGLADLMGHTISLKSREGRGSMFCIHLPRAEAEPARPAAPAIAVLNRARVLVVDDDADVRAGLAEVLNAWGCEATLFDSLDEFLGSPVAAAPDLVIADYRLRAGRTGIEAVARIRDYYGQTIPALIVTGDSDPARLQEAKAAGLNVLHKPVQPAKLRALMVKIAPQTGVITGSPVKFV